MTESLATAASNGSIVPHLVAIICDFTHSTSSDLAQRRMYVMQINSTLSGMDGMISGREKLKSSERTHLSNSLSTIHSCWPLSFKPQYPQWEADDQLSHVTSFLPMCLCSTFQILNSYPCWNYPSWQGCQSLHIHQWATSTYWSLIRFQQLSNNSVIYSHKGCAYNVVLQEVLGSLYDHDK